MQVSTGLRKELELVLKEELEKAGIQDTNQEHIAKVIEYFINAQAQA